MLKNKFLSLLTLLVVAFSFTFPTAKAVELPPGTKLASKQVLNYAIGSTPESLDPGINVDWSIQQVLKSLYDTLVRQDYTGKIVGVGATSWQVSDNGLTWTFHLRPEAKWTDGKPVTAHDYVYAWQRVLDPKVASLGADFISALNLKNTAQIRQGKLPPSELGVEAKDDYTLVLHLSRPTPWLLDTVSLLPTAPVRKDIIEKYGRSWTKPENIVSNGPFKLVSNKFNEALQFNLRNDYWDRKNIYITQINYEVLPKGQSSYLKYLAGEFYTARIPAQYFNQVLEQRPNEMIAEPYPSTYALVLNTRLEKLSNPEVRQAISLLLDRNLIAQKFYRFYTPTSLVAPAMLGDGRALVEKKNLIKPEYRQANIKKAIALLEKAGYSKEKPLELTWTHTKGNEAERNNIAMSSMLSDFSGGLIKVKLQAFDLTSYYYKIQHSDFELAFYIINPDFYHVASFYNIFNPGNSNNFSGWTDKKFTELYEKAYFTEYDKQRAAIYQELNKILQEQVPVVPIVLSARVIVKSPALGGFNGKLPYTYMRDYYIIADKKIAPVK
ncbi:peptide ABC transporter substrate-binding protein [Psittacicella hinzii]|uniref:peptide ABC transporter substrate-binding protein n=1 Tax=Psittacicella hinzii TaxID=2028575 RepID=UPI001CA6A762|nr:peptide ABC transporter substrate-binding protein [Psittacicella hinzii]